MDCPHGNWWFYVWHRGYLGYFEQTIRKLSGDDTFAIPYWDWTASNEIPAPMFDGVLNPADSEHAKYTRNLAVFTAFIQPTLAKYWGQLSPAQQKQLDARGYTEFQKLWNDVTGFAPSLNPPDGVGVAGNIAYANPCGSRYLTRDNPKLDEKTTYNVSPFIVYSGLLPTDFYNPVNTLSFNSSRTPSHNTPPSGPDIFSVLEGFPHNKVHNYIGGVGPLDPGPYGFMTNFLSPLDPVFFLHHSNMDRLWDVWTRKQQSLGLPYLPEGPDWETYSTEPFLFFVNSEGEYVSDGRAGDYVSMERFDYDYEPGFGEKIIRQSSQLPHEKTLTAPLKGKVLGNAAVLSLPSASVKSHLANEFGSSIVAEVTLPRPEPTSSVREFDVIVGAPPDVKQVSADSPYYAGTIAFFGNMMNMTGMAPDATFVVPLPRKAALFRGMETEATANVSIRVVPSRGPAAAAPKLKSAVIQAF